MEEQLIATEEKNGSLIVTILSKQLHMYHIPDFKDEVAEILEKKPARVVLNLSNVDYLDSSAMGALFHIHKQIDAYKGSMAVAGISHAIAIVFRLTKSDQHFKIFETLEAALA